MNTLLNVLSFFEGIILKSKKVKLGEGTFIKPYFKIKNKDGRIIMGKNIKIAEGCFISMIKSKQALLAIGDNTDIGRFLTISCGKKIRIGKNVMTSSGVTIVDGIHEYINPDLPVLRQKMGKFGDVIIEDDSFIGVNAVIMPGVTVGKHSVVGANSVVTKSVAPYSVVAGVPAKVIKQYNFKKKAWVKV